MGMNQQTVPDGLQEPAEMSLANAIIEGAEQPGPGTAHGDNPVPVEATAVVPVAVSTPEKVAPEANPTAEVPQTPVNPAQGAKACGTLQVPSYPTAPQTTVFTVAQHQYLCQEEPETSNDCR